MLPRNIHHLHPGWFLRPRVPSLRLYPPRASPSASKSMSSSHPPWLTPILQSKAPAPKIYSWTPEPNHTPRVLDDLDRRIFVLGVGNMGRIYASYLAKGNTPVTLVLHRKELLQQWKDAPGIQITRLGVTETNSNFDVQYWTEEPPSDHGSAHEILDGGIISNILICTKASTALPEADRLRRYLNASSTVAFAQNGMSKMWPPHGSAYVAHRYPENDTPSFIACITTHGVISLAPFRSKHASLADAKVGLVLPSATNPHAARYMMDAIAAAPQLDSQLVSRADLWVLQLEKLVVNSVINPMTAVLRCQNGLLFEGDESSTYSQIMDRLLCETSQVFQALVHHPSSATILSENSSISVEALAQRFSLASLRAMLWGVGHKVKENTSSMLQDVRAGKQTEIRDFNGWIVDMARFLDQGLDTCTHERLIALVEENKVLTETEFAQALQIQQSK